MRVNASCSGAIVLGLLCMPSMGQEVYYIATDGYETSGPYNASNPYVIAGTTLRVEARIDASGGAAVACGVGRVAADIEALDVVSGEINRCESSDCVHETGRDNGDKWFMADCTTVFVDSDCTAPGCTWSGVGLCLDPPEIALNGDYYLLTVDVDTTPDDEGTWTLSYDPTPGVNLFQNFVGTFLRYNGGIKGTWTPMTITVGPAAGACCVGLSCIDDVLPPNCIGTWKGAGTVCKDVDVVCECVDDDDCDDNDECTDDVCVGTQCVFPEITNCGACCDSNGGCTEGLVGSCPDPDENFFEGKTCAAVSCVGACCTEYNGVVAGCVVMTKQDCEALGNGGDDAYYQGHGTLCPPVQSAPADHLSVMVHHFTGAPWQCSIVGPLAPRAAASIPGDPIDPWRTMPDALMCHQFDAGPESPAIPADFFGPGSDPFTDEVCLEGQPLGPISLPGYPDPMVFGQADTLVKRSGDPFDRCELPSPTGSTVETQIVALNLKSTGPITITYNGGQDPEEWDVKVDLSDVTPAPGWITAVKTHCNGGTYVSELHVQPRFTFTKVGDPTQEQVLDTGLEDIPYVTLIQDDDPPWTSDLSPGLTWPSPIDTDFHPSVEDTEPTIDCDCNQNGVRDKCDIEDPTSDDCNTNGTPDECELSANDCNGNDIPDECEADCQPNGVPDGCDIADGTSVDCQPNGIPDVCDIAQGTSQDVDQNGSPDECGGRIPTVSEWGLVIMALLLLTGLKIKFGRRRSAQA